MKRIGYVLVPGILAGAFVRASAQWSVGGMLGFNIATLKVEPEITSEADESIVRNRGLLIAAGITFPL